MTELNPSPARIRQTLEEYHRPLPEGIELLVAEYMNLLALWGRKMSLTAIQDPEEVVREHFGESIFALSLSKLPEGRLADVGTGAGFPGLAIKLAVPGLPVALIEPNKKKCAFLQEVIRALSLTDVAVTSVPFQLAEIQEDSLGSVTSRALGLEKALFAWSRTALRPSGRLLLWLGEENSRIAVSSHGWKWDEPVLIPGSRKRYILRGVPEKT